jgi:signal transduction histidine kinase/ActR/RegA family two-component response regulator/HAMP domain-containing protein
VAREVGTEGKLGGQAQVKGVAGTWRDLTESVNQLASTLTTQLRAIAEVSTAVTRGDLTQQISVLAQGEVAELKNTLNRMIATLRETTNMNAEQGWLDSNLARIGGLLQGQRDLDGLCEMIMREVTPLVNAQVGAFFLADHREGLTSGDTTGQSKSLAAWRRRAAYGLPGARGDAVPVFAPGEGLVGQVGTTNQTVVIRDVPDGYLPVRSGTGAGIPRAVVVLPVLFEGEALGVIEFGSLAAFSELHMTFLERLVVAIGVAINTIQANRRTEALLTQSQRLTLELQEQSAELQRTNAELEEKAELLSEQNRNIEIKNMEIDTARRGVEEKAQQLAQASQYKSEFLANMSHELRTPLNSLLLLSRLLADNPESNLTPKQREFAATIYKSGSDLLALIDDILDLSKIEAGRVDLNPSMVDLAEIRTYVEQVFRPQAEDKKLEFRVRVAPEVGAMLTDSQRLQQILRNLLSNAIKFTSAGSVGLSIGLADGDAAREVGDLDPSVPVIAFAVADTGIGIADEKLAMIFEAFQQADGTTSRRFGGTGLGLSISKELARMLGGRIDVRSTVGVGSTFTLYLPSRMTASVETTTVPPRAEPVELPVGIPIIRPRPPQATPSVAASALRDKVVLIVDDDVRNVFALTSALEMHGLTVLYADNGAEGIRLLSEHPEVDIVLMDAMMPDLDGNETTRRMRRLPRGASLPIVFLTAKAMPGDRETSLAAGASDYVTKPVDLDELLSVLNSWISPADPVGHDGIRPDADYRGADGRQAAP